MLWKVIGSPPPGRLFPHPPEVLWPVAHHVLPNPVHSSASLFFAFCATAVAPHA